MRQLIKKHFITIKDAAGVHAPLYIVLGLMIALTGFSLWLPHLLKQKVGDVSAFSLIAGTETVVAQVPTNSKVKMLYVNQTYYLMFSSTTNDGSAHNLYMTTSTNGTTWSSSTEIYSLIDNGVGNSSPASFDFAYNTVGGYFGMIMVPSSTVAETSHIGFASSTNAGTWSATTTLDSLEASAPESTHSSGRPFLTFATNTNYMAVAYQRFTSATTTLVFASSTNDGVSFTTSTIITDLTPSAQGRLAGIALSNYSSSDNLIHVAYSTGNENGEPLVPVSLVYASSTDNGETFVSTVIDNDLESSGVSPLAPLGEASLAIDSFGRAGISYVSFSTHSCDGVCTLAGSVMYGLQNATTLVWTTTTVDNFSGSAIPGSQPDIDISFGFYSQNAPLFAYAPYNGVSDIARIGFNTTTVADVSGIVTSTVGTSAINATVAGQLSMVYATNTQKVAVAYVTGNNLIVPITTLLDPDVELVVPELSSASITNAIQYVPVDARLTFTFDTALAVGTVTTGNVTLQANSPNTQGGTPSGTNLCDSVLLAQSNTEIICNHLGDGAPLATSTWYTITLDTGITDSNGIALASNITRVFQTGDFTPGNNITVPTVVSSYPAPGNQIAINSNLEVQFSANMAVSGSGSVISTTNVSLRTASYGQPTGDNICADDGCTLSYNSDNKKLTINPASNLTESSEYVLTVTGQTTNNITISPSTYFVGFRTTAGADSTAPYITGINPASSTTDVILNTQAIDVFFSEAMSESTIASSSIQVFKDANTNYILDSGELMTSSSLGFAYDSFSNTVHVGLANMLDQNSRYCVKLFSSITDLNGNALGTSVRCFTTVNAVYSAVAPTVVSMDVDNYSVWIQFDQPLASDGAPTSTGNIVVGIIQGGSLVSLVDLTNSSVTLQYRPEANAIEITGLALTNGQTLQATITNVKDKSGAETIVNNGSTNVAKAVVLDSTLTGGLIGGFNMQSFDQKDMGIFMERPERCFPEVRLVSSTSKYRCEFPSPVALTTGSQVIITFPAGTVTTGGYLPASSTSYTVADLNGPAPGTPYAVSTSSSAVARTFTFAVNGSVAVNDQLAIEIAGIRNASTAGEKTITAIIKDSNGIKQGQTIQFAPYVLNQGGSLSISGTLCKGASSGGVCDVAGSDSAINGATVFLNSFKSSGAGGIMGGRQETTTDASGDFIFNNLTAGEYGVSTFINPDVSAFDNVSGGNMFQEVVVAGSSITDTDFRFLDISSSGGQTLTINITGGPASTQVDVFCFAPGSAEFSGAVMKSTTLDGDGVGSATMKLSQNIRYECGMGPHMPIETRTNGQPPQMPDFTFMPPQPQTVAIAEADLGITFALKTADIEIKGVVTDESGTTIQNVFVDIFPAFGKIIDQDTGGFVDMRGTKAKTGTNGTFTGKISGNGTFKVIAFAPGMPPSKEYEVTVKTEDSTADSNNTADVYNKGTLLTGNGLVIKMAKTGTTISGTVYDENNNHIEYGFVDAQKVGSSDTCLSFTPQGGFTGSPSDSNGNYTLYVENGTYRIAAFSSSYGEVDCEIKTVSDSSLTGIDLQASAGSYATISGTVTKGGTATSGADVGCFGSAGGNHTKSTTDGSYSMTVKAGTYTCRGFLPGAGQLTASTGQFALSAEGTQTVNFTIGNPGTITVALGADITNAFCDARDSSGNGNGTGQADGSGNYNINVPAGTYNVQCMAPTRGLIGSSAGVAVTAGGSTNVTISPPAVHIITGRITDGSSNLQGAIITFIDKDSGRVIPVTSNGASGTNDNVSISIPAGTYSIAASKSGYVDSGAPQALAVSATGTFNTRTLTQASATVSITVQANGTNYTGGGAVVATKSDGKVVMTKVDTAITSGANAIINLTDGTWSINGFGDNGKKPSSATTITVTDDTPDIASFTMNLNTAITGYTPTENKRQSMIPASGGLFNNQNLGQNFEVNIPVGILSTSDSSPGSMQTNFSPYYAIDTPGKKFIGNAAIEITPLDSNGTAITSIEGAVTIKLPYTDADVTTAGVSESDLNAAYWNDSAGDWEALPGVIDTENKVIIAQTTHFSTFGIVGSNAGGTTAAASTASASSATGAGVAIGANPPAVKAEQISAVGKISAESTYVLNKPTPLTVGASNHTITVLSANSTKAQIKVESEPITIWVNKDEKTDVDTNQDGINDLRIKYLGLAGKEANIEFTNLTDDGELKRGITINAGSFYSSHREVEVTLNVDNTKWYAISNSEDFSGSVFEDIVSSTKWTLTTGDGEKTVYVRFRSAEGGTLDLTDTITLMNQGFKQEVGCTLEKEQPYMERTSPAIYYITKQCTKRAFTTSQKYFSYFKSWKDVIIISKAELSNVNNDALGFMPWGPNYNPKYGALVKITSDPKTYLLLAGKKYWINSEVTFAGLGYTMDWVEDIDEKLLDKYLEGGEITNTATHVEGTIVKYKVGPEVYRIEDGKKLHIKDEATFVGLGYRWDRILTIPDTEIYEDGDVIE